MRKVAVLISLLAAVCAHGQVTVPPVPAAFDNTSSHNPGQLLYRQVGLGRVTNIIYHNGSIYTNVVTGADRRVFQWSDPSDIASLTQVLANADGDSIPLYNDHGNHAHTKVGDYIGGTFDMRIRRVSPGVNAFDQRHPDWIGTPGDHQLYWPWSLPFNWLQYSSEENGDSFIRRFDDELYAWNSLAEHGVTGNYILMGNLLLVTSDESLLGILAYDLSPTFQDPPQAPILLDKLSGPVGAYIAVPWQNYLVLARRDTDTVDVVDWSDPTDLRFVASIDVSGDSDLNAGTNVPYTQCQDEFIFARRHKINMETLQPVLELDEVGDNRPSGSVSGPLGTSQYMMPLGPYLVTGAYSSSGRDGIGVWAHQAGPDVRAPAVGYHIPRDGQTNYPTRAPISLLIHETLESYTIINGETIILRPIGGSAIPCYASFAHDDVLTLTPMDPLADGTTYEVVIPAGGIKDACGNGIEPYSFTFSTGSGVSGGNLSPVIDSFTATPSPTAPNTPIAIAASASDPESDPLEYRFSFNDGTAPTAWSSTSTTSHTFTEPGHYDIKVQVRDTKPSGANSVVTAIITATIASPPTGPFPTHSSQLALAAGNRRIYAVNPDNDSVSVVDADSLARVAEFDLGALIQTSSIDPRSIALAASGQLWVTCRDADGIAVLDSNGSLVEFLATGYGSAPVGIAVTPGGSELLVTLEGRGATDSGNGQMLRLNAVTRTEVDRLELGPMPRAIAITGNGERALVTRFISPENYGEVWDIDLTSSLSLTRTIVLRRDRGNRGFDTSSDGKGVPNYLASIVITPDNQFAWFAAKKDQTQRGLFFDLDTGTNQALTPDHTVRAMVGVIDLSTNREPNVNTFNPEDSSRLDIDNSESPVAIAFSPLADYAFIALQGNNEVAVYDMLALGAGTTKTTTWRIPAGAAPQGLLVDPATSRLLIKNFLSRDLATHDLSSFFASGDRSLQPATTGLVSAEKLSASALAGKRTFYHASDAMSLETYISCASCHVDGMHDGHTYDFTQRGEGLRNTTDLRGRGGTDHGPVHWSGNFDESQDFQLDIVNHFGGTGFLHGEPAFPSLETPNAGRTTELDELAAYLASLKNDSVPKSPYRHADGTMTTDALLGATLFHQEDCHTCHPPTSYTDSTLNLFHNVGTHRTGSGTRLDQPLTGIDTPTLLGAWSGAPYFHDGQAETLPDVFVVAGGTVYQAESATHSPNISIPGFIAINQDSSVHGEMVQFQAAGASVTFTNVDGGSGGTGAVELRYAAGRTGSYQVSVNGTSVATGSFTNDLTALEWKRARFENIPLTAGTTNTIVIEALDQRFDLDDMTVSTADDLALAAPHRRVLALTATEQAQLLAYVRQLDGRDAAGVLLNSPPIAAATYSPKMITFGDGYETLVTFDGSASSDPDGSIAHYMWNIPGANFVHGTQPSDPRPEVVFPGGGDAIATLIVTDDDGLSSTLRLNLAVHDPNPGSSIAPGLLYEYYETGALTQLPDFDTLTPTATGSISNFSLSPASATSRFAFRFVGRLEIQVPGEYTFYTTSDDGSQLFINGARVVDNDGLHGNQTRSGSVTLAAGFHDIIVTYFENNGGESLTVEYEGPGITRRTIPNARLTNGTPAPPRSLARATFDEWINRNTGLLGHETDPLVDITGSGTALLTAFSAGVDPAHRVVAIGTADAAAGHPSFIADRLRQVDGLSHQLFYSTDLVEWFDASPHYTLSTDEVAPGVFKHTYTRNSPLPPNGQEFLRLETTLSETP